MKRVLSFILTVVLLLCMLPACKSNQNNQENSTAQSSTTTATVSPTEDLGTLVSKDPINLTFHITLSGFPYHEDVPVWAELAKRTNVTLKGTVPETATDMELMFNLMMSSGEISDIVYTTKSNFNKFGQQGAFKPLNDLIKQYAPNLSKFLDERPDVRRFATAADGKMYFIPFIPDGQVAKGWFIRKDWLDKLKLPVPGTAEEFYNTMVAFRDQDPNGNGAKDEIPFFTRDWWDSYFLPCALQGVNADLHIDENGKVRHGLYTPEAYNGIAYAIKWYKEGIMDAEVFTRGDARKSFFGEKNNGGATHDWFASTAATNDQLKSVNPQLNLVPMAPPEGTTGKRMELTSRETVRGFGWGMSVSNPHAVETIKYFDYFFTEEGRRLMNFGIEGVDYSMQDGKPVFTAKVLENTPVIDYLRGIGAQWEVGYHQDFAYEEQLMNQIAKDGVKMYMDNNYPVPMMPNLDFSDAESQLISDKGTAIASFIDESMQKFITGNMALSTSTFDEFTSGLKKLGMDEYLATYQAAYDKYLKK